MPSKVLRSTHALKPEDYFMTLEETAIQLAKDEGAAKPLGRERIRQIELKALEKVRKALEERGLGRSALDDLLPDGPAFFDANSRTPYLRTKE